MTDETTPEGAAAPEEAKVEKVTETEAKSEKTGEEAAPESKEEMTEETTDEAKPKGKGFQKRINQLTRNVRELERALEMERASRQQASEKKEVKGEPKLEDYDDFGKYAKDVAKWEVAQVKGELTQKQAEEVQRVLVMKAQDDFRERLETFADTHDDFQELVEEIGPLIKGAALETLMDSKHGPEIIYHLGKNPEEAERLSKLSPLAAAREIGRIEERLNSKSVKRTTNAPPPSKTITGSSPASTPLDKMDMKDFIKARRAQLNNR